MCFDGPGNPSNGVPVARRPPDPVEQLVVSDVDLAAVEDSGERLLEQVGAVQGAAVRCTSVSLPFSTSERFHGFFCNTKRVPDGVPVVGIGGTPLPPAYLIERVVSEALHVKAVEDQSGLRGRPR